MSSAVTMTSHFLAVTGNLTFDLRLVGRMALGAVLGYAVGWERQFRGSTAGERTFALVALGAAAFTVVGVEDFPATAEKVLAGIVTGVGFLGAGMIMRESGGIFGLTTAAAIWAVSAVGILAGVGEPLITVLAAALLILILELQHLPGAWFLDAGHARRAWLKRQGKHDDKPAEPQA